MSVDTIIVSPLKDSLNKACFQVLDQIKAKDYENAFSSLNQMSESMEEFKAHIKALTKLATEKAKEITTEATTTEPDTTVMGQIKEFAPKFSVKKVTLIERFKDIVER